MKACEHARVTTIEHTHTHVQQREEVAPPPMMMVQPFDVRKRKCVTFRQHSSAQSKHTLTHMPPHQS